MAPKKPKDFQEEAQKLEDEFGAEVAFSAEAARRIMNAPAGSMFIFQHGKGTGEYVPPAEEKKKKGK